MHVTLQRNAKESRHKVSDISYLRSWFVHEKMMRYNELLLLLASESKC